MQGCGRTVRCKLGKDSSSNAACEIWGSQEPLSRLIWCRSKPFLVTISLRTRSSVAPAVAYAIGDDYLNNHTGLTKTNISGTKASAGPVDDEVYPSKLAISTQLLSTTSTTSTCVSAASSDKIIPRFPPRLSTWSLPPSEPDTYKDTTILGIIHFQGSL